MCNYLDNNPSFVEEYFADADWNAFAAEKERGFSKEKSMQLRKGVFTVVKKKATILSFIKFSVAALVVLGLGFYTWQVYSEQKQPEMIIRETSMVNIQTRYNYSAIVKKLWLPDSSYVLLALNSKIRYLTNFSEERRMVFLEGTAIFQVSKDKRRPFVVISSGISTTALGTRFKVTAPNGGAKRSVFLYEGKVVVSAENHRDGRYYLLPGYSLTYNKLTSDFNVDSPSVKISNFAQVPAAPVQTTHPVNLTAAEADLSEDTRFENVPLEKVLAFLSARYDEEIHCEKQIADQINFVGTIHKNDSLNRILEDISLINHLHLRKAAADSGYYLKK